MAAPPLVQLSCRSEDDSRAVQRLLEDAPWLCKSSFVWDMQGSVIKMIESPFGNYVENEDDVLELLPFLHDVKKLGISRLVQPLSIPIHRAITIELPVSAIRHTHDTVDGRAIFRHDEDTQE